MQVPGSTRVLAAICDSTATWVGCGGTGVPPGTPVAHMQLIEVGIDGDGWTEVGAASVRRTRSNLRVYYET